MYWIYLIVFTVMIFIPQLVGGGNISLFWQELAESILILLLGMIGFLIFLWNEWQLKISRAKRLNAQRESKRIFKDLSEAYSYIGEVNRKLDILRDIGLLVPTNLQSQKRNLAAMDNQLIEALELFGRSNRVVIQIIDIGTKKVIKEARRKKVDFPMTAGEVIDRPENFIETDEFAVAKSPDTLDGAIAAVAVRKLSINHTIEDPQMLKSLASQALTVFILESRKKS